MFLSSQFWKSSFSLLCTCKILWSVIKLTVYSNFFGHNLKIFFLALAFDFLQSEVFAVAFALLAAGVVILTLNVLLLVIASSAILAHTTKVHFCILWIYWSDLCFRSCISLLSLVVSTLGTDSLTILFSIYKN